MTNPPEYPQSFGQVEADSRSYCDEAAMALYKLSGGEKLVSAHMRATSALIRQTQKLEEFHNTPYTEEHAKLIATTTDTIAKLEGQLERWHYLIYPNQRPT